MTRTLLQTLSTRYLNKLRGEWDRLRRARHAQRLVCPGHWAVVARQAHVGRGDGLSASGCSLVRGKPLCRILVKRVLQQPQHAPHLRMASQKVRLPACKTRLTEIENIAKIGNL